MEEEKRKPIKARIYLYDKDAIIQKVTYAYDDGSESEPLQRTFHLGMFQDTVLFGNDLQIRFFLYNGMARGIKPYDSDVQVFEIVNNSKYSVFYSSGRNETIIEPGDTATVSYSSHTNDIGNNDEVQM